MSVRSLGRAELAARLCLLATPGIPQHRVLQLLRERGSGIAACASLRSDVGREVAAAARSEAVRRRVSRALASIERDRIRVVAHDDSAYPRRLLQRLGAYAPPVLFTLGRLDLLARICVAVVGCRRATEYGLDISAQVAAGVARAGGCVVSGLARGVDAAAHAAALEAGGGTIAVLGCGVDVMYPRENSRLQAHIAGEGLLVSEWLPGEPPRKHQFPHRNRVIAALSKAVVVVEAGERSGAVSTGNHAVAQSVDVYGVMNAMDRPNVQGIVGLIRDGAFTFTGVADLLRDVGLLELGTATVVAAPVNAARDAAPPPGTPHARVWQALGVEPDHVDGVAARTGLDTGVTLVTLLELELDGRVRQFPGRRFARRRERVPAA